ncbi:MAG: hypothetical protein JO036_18210 [Candidatus Eremiobacteraeota bacterium]|nr:hypothetical protein [Candidatus Eremiobacteraeota bacterium]
MLDKIVPQPTQQPVLHSHPLTALQKEHIFEHYQRALPLMVLDFPHVPFVGAFHPYGLGNQPTFSGGWPELPESIAHVEVTGAQGKRHLYPGLTENAVLWLVHMGAVGVESWTPSPRDPESVGYARILLRQSGSAGEQELKYAMLAMRTALLECRGLRAVPVLDGDAGAALFVPFADLPLYEDVRAWLHRLCNAAAEKHPALLTCAKKEQAGDRVHLSVEKNAVGQHSKLPYSLAGNPGLHMVTPIEWNELGEAHNGMFTARTSAKRLEHDVFAEQAAAIGEQRFSDVRSTV